MQHEKMIKKYKYETNQATRSFDSTMMLTHTFTWTYMITLNI